MHDLDQLLLGSGIFAGRSGYLDAFPGLAEPQPRIYVKFRPHGAGASFLALLDTGAHFCILNREIAEEIRAELGEPLESMTLRTARGLVRGQLHLHTIELIGEKGEGLDVPTTVFVSPEWSAPSFLGYSGALERVIFSVDPKHNRFYFGTLE